jgi:hypothetical protein
MMAAFDDLGVMAGGRGDFGTVMGLLDPNVEWITPQTLPWSRGDYHGRISIGITLPLSPLGCLRRVQPDS